MLLCSALLSLLAFKLLCRHRVQAATSAVPYAVEGSNFRPPHSPGHPSFRMAARLHAQQQHNSSDNVIGHRRAASNPSAALALLGCNVTAGTKLPALTVGRRLQGC